MRLIRVTCIGLLFAGTAPAAARDYPWCQREPGNGGSLQCRFMTLQQCQASASGLGGGCLQNPAGAGGQAPGLQSNPGLQSSAMQDAPPSEVAPRRRPYRVRHQPGKHGWYYE
jgi:uncharacterized protein DUF3551